jgi:hypothetical protein
MKGEKAGQGRAKRGLQTYGRLCLDGMHEMTKIPIFRSARVCE